MHVNFRGYPGHTAIPRCTTVIPNGTKTIRGKTACFADASGMRTAPGIKATVYRVNQDADQWHILLAWKHNGSLYTVSEHVIKPYDNSTVVLKNLARLLRSLVLVRPAGLMRLTRRSFLGGAAAAAVGGAGIYELVDRLDGSPPRARVAGPLPPEQHVFDLRAVQSEGVEVLVPPLHSEVVTATIEVDDLRAAQHDLEPTLQDLDAQYAPDPRGSASRSPGGCRTSTARPAAGEAHLPFDHRAGKSVLLPSRRFPSDPDDDAPRGATTSPCCCAATRREHIDAGAQGDLRRPRRSSTPTSIRRGFAGGGFDGKQSLPKKMAMAAGVPGADLIPDTSELFLGFTSTQKAGLGPRLIANHETLGYVDLRGGYFHGGTHMHLSHISEDLEAWYLNFDFDERVLTVVPHRPDDVKQGTQTVPQGAEGRLDAQGARRRLQADRAASGTARRSRRRRASRSDVIGPDGTVYPKGTAIPQRADFNTLDNPFAFSSQPELDQMKQRPRRPASTSSSSTRPATTSSATASRWTASCPTARSSTSGAQPRAGLQLGADDDAPPELPRAAAAAPLVPARGAASRRRLAHLEPFRRHGLQLRRRLRERDRHDVVAAQRRHLPELPGVRELRSLQAVARREHAVARVGVPPRCTCPSTVTRVSKPVRCSISRPSTSPTPRCARITCPN